MRKLLPRLLCCLLMGLSLPLAAQKQFAQQPASIRTLIAIKVTGGKRYPEQTIAAACGLQLGAVVTEDDFKSAARRLGDLGVFTDVGYSYSFSSAGTKLEFQVSDVTKFVPVHFEDFVWFSDEELLKRVKQSVPMFDGELPEFGKMADQVSDVLQAMLVERSIPGHVEYVRSGKGDSPGVVYQVANVVVQIRNVEFTGAAEADVPALKAAAQRVFDREYSRTVLSALVQHQLLPVYHARGYLKAAFGPPEPKVVKQPSESNDAGIPNLTVVDVNFAVTPGQQYKLKSLEWSGNQAFPTETLQKMVHAKPGEPANTVRIGDNLKDIQKLYGSRGYVTATLNANADFDDAAGTVAIRIDVKEGAVYHMGELAFRGLDNALTAKLRNAWKIRTGDVYDATYLSEYLPIAQKLLPSTLDWESSSHVTANIGDKTVDVDLIYAAKAPK